MYKELFDERKAAQMAAYFLMRAAGSLQVLKLMKLMYLAERLSFQQYGEGIVGDRLVSMPHGPVMSLTYSHMQGELNRCQMAGTAGSPIVLSISCRFTRKSRLPKSKTCWPSAKQTWR